MCLRRVRDCIWSVDAMHSLDRLMRPLASKTPKTPPGGRVFRTRKELLRRWSRMIRVSNIPMIEEFGLNKTRVVVAQWVDFDRCLVSSLIIDPRARRRTFSGCPWKADR